MTGTTSEDLRLSSPTGRWVIAAAVLGSGMAFLDATIINVALPSIGSDLGTSFTGLQWTVNAYLVTLSALLLVGGTLGDRFGQRTVFVWGLTSFTVASVACGIAPTIFVLNVARAAQGVGGALLVPTSLAIVGSSFHPEDRGRAVGLWAGLSGVSTAVGPFIGGWLIDVASWRAAFFLNVFLAVPAIAIALKHVPDSRSPTPGRLDLPGAALVTIGLGGISYFAIEFPGTPAMVFGAIGLVSLIGFVIFESFATDPMLRIPMFRSKQFTGTNLVTLAVYAGLSGAMFMVTIRLQVSLDYSALEAGAALVPFSVIMLVFSPTAGRLGQAIGPRVPLTVGPVISGAGILMLGSVGPGNDYLTGVLPGVIVLGIGMTIVVAPLTTAVLASGSDALIGAASGVNNSAAKLAGLLAVAALPGLAGMATGASLEAGMAVGYERSIHLAAGVTALGGLIAAAMVRRTYEPFVP